MVFVRRQKLNNTTIRRLSLLLFLKKKAGGGSQCRIAIALAIWYNIYFLHRVNINTDTHISEEDIQIPYFSPKEIREYSDIFLSNDPSYKFKNVKKTIDIKDSSGNIVCSLTLRATFKYNGTNSVCCGSSTKKRILNEDWHFGECSHTNTYDKVIARYTYYFKTVENSFSDLTSISCDENGNIY